MNYEAWLLLQPPSTRDPTHLYVFSSWLPILTGASRHRSSWILTSAQRVFLTGQHLHLLDTNTLDSRMRRWLAPLPDMASMIFPSSLSLLSLMVPISVLSEHLLCSLHLFFLESLEIATSITPTQHLQISVPRTRHLPNIQQMPSLGVHLFFKLFHGDMSPTCPRCSPECFMEPLHLDHCLPLSKLG